jgi:hypothetical protein
MSGEPVDMSPEAVARRLRRLAGLYRLARSLKQARILGPVEPAAEATPPGDPQDRRPAK